MRSPITVFAIIAIDGPIKSDEVSADVTAIDAIAPPRACLRNDAGITYSNIAPANKKLSISPYVPTKNGLSVGSGRAKHNPNTKLGTAITKRYGLVRRAIPG